MTPGCRGQMSMELLVGIMFVMFILLLSAIYASQKSSESDDLKLKTDGRRVCNSFGDNINNIAEQGNGFYKYFRLPEKIYGDNDYNVTVYGNWVEINFNDYSWTRQMVTSNITIICLDKGLTKKNKIYNLLEKIYVICNMPELIVVNSSLRPVTVAKNKSLNISFQVMNFGPVDAGQFNVVYNGTQTQTVPSLGSEKTTYLTFSIVTPPNAGYYPINITIDSNNSVNESIEWNNLYNETIRVV